MAPVDRRGVPFQAHGRGPPARATRIELCEPASEVANTMAGCDEPAVEFGVCLEAILGEVAKDSRLVSHLCRQHPEPGADDVRIIAAQHLPGAKV